MTCDQVRELLPELAEGLLGGASRERVELHLGQCPACAAELAALRRVDELLAGAADEPPPAELWAGIESRLAAPPTHRFRYRWALATVAACAALVVVIIGHPAPQTATPYLRDHYRASTTIGLGNPAVGDIMAALATEQGQ